MEKLKVGVLDFEKVCDWLERNLCDPHPRGYHVKQNGLRTYGRNSTLDTMPGAFSFVGKSLKVSKMIDFVELILAE